MITDDNNIDDIEVKVLKYIFFLQNLRNIFRLNWTVENIFLNAQYVESGLRSNPNTHTKLI